MFESVRNRIRSVLSLRKERAMPRRGPKPAIGAGIFREDLRMTVQAGFSNDLWRWLLEQGWREVRYRPDRRQYREIPASWVTQLIDAAPETRAAVLQQAAAQAVLRPVRNPRAMHSYAARE